MPNVPDPYVPNIQYTGYNVNPGFSINGFSSPFQEIFGNPKDALFKRRFDGNRNFEGNRNFGENRNFDGNQNFDANRNFDQNRNVEKRMLPLGSRRYRQGRRTRLNGSRFNVGGGYSGFRGGRFKRHDGDDQFIKRYADAYFSSPKRAEHTIPEKYREEYPEDHPEEYPAEYPEYLKSLINSHI